MHIWFHLKCSTFLDEPKSEKSKSSTDRSSTESGSERRGSKKRSKHEVDGMSSPEQEKRQKRNASVKAKSIISKQVSWLGLVYNLKILLTFSLFCYHL